MISIEQLAPYLPYGLELASPYLLNNSLVYNKQKLTGLNIQHMCERKNQYKPVLRPMSDIYKPIVTEAGFTVNTATKLYHVFDITDMEFNGNATNPLYGYQVYTFLISLHFDVFGLIETGQAIDINVL